MQDAFDLNAAVLHNSPDFKSYAVTSEILRFRSSQDNPPDSDKGGHQTIDHTKDSFHGQPWPSQPFGDPAQQGNVQFTLCHFFKIGDTWHGAGGIEFWAGCVANGGPLTKVVQRLYYASDRWGEMASHQIQPGDQIGIMVVAGDARGDHPTQVHERSNIVLVAAEADLDVTFEAGQISLPTIPTPPAPPTTPAATPTPQPIDDRIRALLTGIVEQLVMQSTNMANLTHMVEEVRQATGILVAGESLIERSARIENGVGELLKIAVEVQQDMHGVKTVQQSTGDRVAGVIHDLSPLVNLLSALKK